MSDSEVRLQIAEAELNELTEIAAHWEDKWNDKYNEVVSLVGACQYCKNHHYPHCEKRFR